MRQCDDDPKPVRTSFENAMVLLLFTLVALIGIGEISIAIFDSVSASAGLISAHPVKAADH
jgi:hypothetical protein